MTEKRTYSEVGPVGRQVAANVRRLRDARQLTTAALAERVSARGVPMSPTMITKVEKRKRRVTVDELDALADALDVAPTSLLRDPDADPVAEVVAFAERMLRGPFHLELEADADGVQSWRLGGRRTSRDTIPHDVGGASHPAWPSRRWSPRLPRVQRGTEGEHPLKRVKIAVEGPTP